VAIIITASVVALLVFGPLFAILTNEPGKQRRTPWLPASKVSEALPTSTPETQRQYRLAA
jgi:hypothetical protein